MKRSVTVLVSCALVAMSGVGHAQTPGWYVSADILRMTTYGDDVHAGDVVARDVTLAGATADFTTSDVGTIRPIVPKLPQTTSLLVEAGRHGATWGFGGRVWRVSTDASITDTARSEPESMGVSHGTSVRLWNGTFFAKADMFEPSGEAPIDYAAGNALEHVRVEGFAERSWIRDPMLSVSVRLGLAYAHSEDRRFDRLATQSNVMQFSSDENDSSSSEMTFNVVGPVVALAGTSTFGRLGINWLISPSTLIGTAHSDASFDAVESQMTKEDGVVVTMSRAIRGLSISEDTRHLVPALDLQVGAAYRITRGLEVGARIFSSSLFNMPVAPEFDALTFAWSERSSDIGFLAYSAFARVSF